MNKKGVINFPVPSQLSQIAQIYGNPMQKQSHPQLLKINEDDYSKPDLLMSIQHKSTKVHSSMDKYNDEINDNRQSQNQMQQYFPSKIYTSTKRENELIEKYKN